MIYKIIWNPNPIAIEIGPISIAWYGLTWSAAILIGYLYGKFIFNKENKLENDLVPLVQYIFVGALIGARVFNVFYYNLEYFLSDPLMIFRVWEGGLASHGAIMGSILAIYIFSKRNKAYPFWWIVDRAAIVAPLLGAIVRVGNFINGELYGTETTLPWGVVFQHSDPLSLARHPVQLYEAFYYTICALIFFIIYQKIKAIKEGFFLVYFLILVFSGRVLLEFVKDADSVFLVFSQTQLVSVIGLFVAIIVLYKKGLQRPSKQP